VSSAIVCANAPLVCNPTSSLEMHIARARVNSSSEIGSLTTSATSRSISLRTISTLSACVPA